MCFKNKLTTLQDLWLMFFNRFELEDGRGVPTDEVSACSLNFQKLTTDQYATDNEMMYYYKKII